MSKKAKIKIALGLMLIAGAAALASRYVRDRTVALMAPGGDIAEKQRNLIIFSAALSLVVVVPVFVMLFTFAWKYREGNTKKTKYSPEWDRSRIIESIWWGVPALLILILSIVAWNSSHTLDPYKPLASNAKPVEIQVVALDWKWLFIYPEQNIATVNYVQLPVDRPITFTITSDAPMNSFWIPQLGGQVYAMSGMSTKLHLIAEHTGTYGGRSANISGEGFARMTFTARATTQEDFDQWIHTVHRTATMLDQSAYDQLAKPSKQNPVAYYAAVERGLYDTIVMKYMLPANGTQNTDTNQQTMDPETKTTDKVVDTHTEMY